MSRLVRVRQSELGALLGDSFYAAIWQGATAVADLIQIVLVTHALGLEEYGQLAIAMAIVVLVGQLFDLRVGVAATITGAKHVGRDDKRAAGVFQITYLVDGATGVLGFMAVAVTAPFVAPGLVGDQGVLLVVLYGLVLLAQTVDESSFTILRLLDRFRLIAAYAVVAEAIRICLVAAALAAFGTLTSIVLALVMHRVVASGLAVITATVVFRRTTGVSLLRPALANAREDRRPMLKTMIHTNVVSYARLAQTQLPTLVLGAIAGATQAGIYKLGMAAAATVGKLIDPAYSALLPRLSRLWAAGQRHEIRRLIGRLSTIVLPAVAILTIALVVFRGPVVEALGASGAAVADAETVLVLGSLAHAINAALLWNVPTLYAVDRAKQVARLGLLAAGVQLVTLPALTVAWESAGAALSFLLSMVALNIGATLLALASLRKQPAVPVTAAG